MLSPVYTGWVRPVRTAIRAGRRHPFVGGALGGTERLLQHRLARGMTEAMVEVTARASCEAMSTTGELQIRLSTGRLIALPNGARISAYELSGGWGERSGVNSAGVSEDPHNPKELRLRNLTARRWIAIMPDGERHEIDFGSSIRLKAGAQINFGATYGEIVDANAPAYWRRSESAATTRGNFVARHWRGDLSLPTSVWINGVLFGLVWRLLPYPLTFVSTIFRPSGGTWPMLGLILCGIVGAILTLWTVVGIWRSSESYDGRAVWRGAARVAAVLMAIATLAQIAFAVRLL